MAQDACGKGEKWRRLICTAPQTDVWPGGIRATAVLRPLSCGGRAFWWDIMIKRSPLPDEGCSAVYSRLS